MGWSTVCHHNNQNIISTTPSRSTTTKANDSKHKLASNRCWHPPGTKVTWETNACIKAKNIIKSANNDHSHSDTWNNPNRWKVPSSIEKIAKSKTKSSTKSPNSEKITKITSTRAKTEETLRKLNVLIIKIKKPNINSSRTERKTNPNRSWSIALSVLSTSSSRGSRSKSWGKTSWRRVKPLEIPDWGIWGNSSRNC